MAEACWRLIEFVCLLYIQLWDDEAVLEGSTLWETPFLTDLCSAQQNAGGQEGETTTHIIDNGVYFYKRLYTMDWEM